MYLITARLTSDDTIAIGWKVQESVMGRGILLWLLGVPIPVIILLALLWR